MTISPELIKKFSSIRVLCIGDIMLDGIISGSVDRISPEAPAMILDIKDEKHMLGGTANLTSNLVSLGAQTTIIGQTGKDNESEMVEELLHKAGIIPALIKRDNFPTITKTRLVCGTHQLLRLDKEVRDHVPPAVIEVLKNELEKHIESSDIVLLEDYNKGLLTDKSTPALIDICHKHGKTVFIDPKGSDYAKYKGAFLIKPNLKEFEDASGIKLNPEAEGLSERLAQGAEAIFKVSEAKYLLVTLDAYGMVLIPADNPRNQSIFPAKAKKVVDVIGAGDSAFATMTLCFASGLLLSEAVDIASTASAIAVGKFGTQPVTGEELLTFCA